MEGSGSSEQNNNGDADEGEEINLFLNVRKTVGVSVKKSGTVRNVKEVLKNKEGISECVQNIFYCGEWLRDDRKLVDCSIQQNSTLNVLVQNYVPLKLFIKPPSHSHQEIIVIEARSCDTIQNVKSSIMARKEIQSCNFGLIYAGKQLPDDRSLASLNIQGGSTLRMVIVRKDTSTISVKMPEGKTFKVEVKLWYTIGDIKTMVESIVNIPIDDLRFVYNGVLLDDSKNLSCYNVTEECMLEMVPRRFQVFVKDFCGKTGTVDVDAGDLVKNVKGKLSDKLGMPTNVQRLKFEGAYLDDDRNITSYNISRDSTLYLSVFRSSN